MKIQVRSDHEQGREKIWIRRMLSAAAACATVLLIAVMGTSTALAAPSPWWQVLTSSRPTNFWAPTDNVQELTSEKDASTGVLVAKIEVDGGVIGCLGAGVYQGLVTADELCQSLGAGPEAIETALELEQLLEVAFGTTALEVAGGPAGTDPFVVTTPKRSVPTITLNTSFPKVNTTFGKASGKIIAAGGSGRLVLTLTNLGDAPFDASSVPLKVVDKLPAGVVAGGVEALAGAQGTAGAVDCELPTEDEVVCSYGSILPSYEAIEIEILASLVNEPPDQVPAGEVQVSGGNAGGVSIPQVVHVSPEPASFGLENFSAQFEEEGGAEASKRAGSHPFQFTTTIQLNSSALPKGRTSVQQPALPRNVRFRLPEGLVGNSTILEQCPMVAFSENACSDGSVLGVASVTVIEDSNLGMTRLAVPVLNLPPSKGEPARFGFVVAGTPIVIDTEVDPNDHYRIMASVQNASQVAMLLSSTVTFWGAPGDPRHDSSRGINCVYYAPPGVCQRPPNLRNQAFLRMPVSCQASEGFQAEIEPWNVPLGSVIDSRVSPFEAMLGCNQVSFSPEVTASPGSPDARSPSGLEFRLDMPNANLLNPAGISEGQAKKVEVTLPEGVTVNPSEADGLGACTPADYARERFDSAPGEGCPESSKIGSVDISTPLLEEEAHGAVYVAAPYDNPFGSLLSLYMVAKIPARGILVKQAGRVDLNPETGQIVTTFDNLPQLPFSRFALHFKEGARAPLVMPSSCGSYDIVARFTPWNAADPENPQPDEIVTRSSSFTVDHGPNGGACPSGTPPFNPGFTAGTESNSAGSYSPFVAQLTRNDGEQEFSRFSLKLPKGVIGNLSGIPFCSEAGIAQARSRTGVNGGQEELESPSCPAASQIGRTLVGAGVGQALTYVPGKVYLAGPYQGAKLSAVAITPAKVGPFDLGNVVIRQALKVDPVTAEVSTDGSSSDPIPHILQGIVVHARDIRVIVDRKDFVLNPTNCERMTASASVSGLSAVDVSSPFQAADCASLGFKPKLALSLKGATKRTGHPRLKAVLTARKGDANIRGAVVALPHSEFLEQSHIRTICTRVQFNAGGGNGEQCPKGSIYGRVKAVTPLLDEPLSGPVYLRSSNHPLPDLVAALHSGKVDINLDGRIDSINGGIRNSFEAVPDAPVTKFTLEMQGGKKGLLVNSTNICIGKHRASATFTGQNGKRFEANPLLKAKCGGKKKHKKH